jgi:hypothetical protein
MYNKETARFDYEVKKERRKKGHTERLLDNSSLAKKDDRRRVTVK